MDFKKFLKKFYFFGFRYHCNACNARLRTWQWHGINTSVHDQFEMVGSGRRKCLCPICQSIDRERLIIHRLDKMLLKGDWKNKRVLHIAPEMPVTLWMNKNKPLEYCKGDFFAPGYSYDDTVHMDIQKLPFDDQVFDVIICSHVLEHVPDDKKAVKELKRVLRKDGKMIILVPFAMNLVSTIEGSPEDLPAHREEHFGQLDHLRLYGRDFANVLRQLDCKVDFWIPKGKVKRWGLNQNEYLILASWKR